MTVCVVRSVRNDLEAALRRPVAGAVRALYEKAAPEFDFHVEQWARVPGNSEIDGAVSAVLGTVGQWTVTARLDIRDLPSV